MHLGNGCSACAVKHGVLYDTSMGLSPLEGMVMGTRSGDIDPAVLTFLSHKEPMNMDDFDTLLNKKSGLLGVSGLTNDMRDLEDAALKNHKRAKLAIDLFVHRLKKYLGAYLAEMNGADAIVFTGGIGENSSVRSRTYVQEIRAARYRNRFEAERSDDSRKRRRNQHGKKQSENLRHPDERRIADCARYAPLRGSNQSSKPQYRCFVSVIVFYLLLFFTARSQDGLWCFIDEFWQGSDNLAPTATMMIFFPCICWEV